MRDIRPISRLRAVASGDRGADVGAKQAARTGGGSAAARLMSAAWSPRRRSILAALTRVPAGACVSRPCCMRMAAATRTGSGIGVIAAELGDIGRAPMTPNVGRQRR